MQQPLPGAGNQFAALMEQLSRGSEDAVWELVELYGDAIRRAVRRGLNERMRPKFDSLDFVQLVWQSFFRQPTNLQRFDKPEQLIAFLITMARNKVGMEARRRLLGQKYNVNREVGIHELEDDTAARLISSEPEPVAAAIARERWEGLLQDQPPHYRRIVQLRLEGHTLQHIADELHLDESTVRRFLKRLANEAPA